MDTSSGKVAYEPLAAEVKLPKEDSQRDRLGRDAKDTRPADRQRQIMNSSETAARCLEVASNAVLRPLVAIRRLSSAASHACTCFCAVPGSAAEILKVQLEFSEYLPVGNAPEAFAHVRRDSLCFLALTAPLARARRALWCAAVCAASRQGRQVAAAGTFPAVTLVQCVSPTGVNETFCRLSLVPAGSGGQARHRGGQPGRALCRNARRLRAVLRRLFARARRVTDVCCASIGVTRRFLSAAVTAAGPSSLLPFFLLRRSCLGCSSSLFRSPVLCVVCLSDDPEAALVLLTYWPIRGLRPV